MRPLIIAIAALSVIASRAGVSRHTFNEVCNLSALEVVG
jgi:hypothetical protein